MATAHFFVQGKGGAGKSLMASLLYQYLIFHNIMVQGIDLDPINRTLAGYKEFDVIVLDVMDGNDIVQKKFDTIIDSICELPDEAHMIIDNGASSYVSFCGYIKENRIFDVLVEQGHTVYIHSIITGGQALADTLSGLDGMIEHFSDVPIIAWLNPYFGDITLDGNSFFDFKIYQQSSANFKAVIEIPKLKKDPFGMDFEELIAKKWSYDQAVNSQLPIMTRSRLASIWESQERVIDQAYLI